jgi:DnaJ family protein C protein 13
MQRSAAEEIAHLATTARTAQANNNNSSLDWTPGDSYSLDYEELHDEMFVGGVYVRLFLKTPGHPLKNPQTFLEGLLERYTKIIAAVDPLAISTAASPLVVESVDVDAAVFLSAAAVAAIHHHPLLAEHGVALGYVSKLIRALASRVPPSHDSSSVRNVSSTKKSNTNTTSSTETMLVLPADDVSGSALRLLHALASAPSAGEALARSSPASVPVLVAAMQWGGAAAVLAVETLKRGLALGNRSRDLLVGAALGAGLLQLLLQRLDWRSSNGDTSSTTTTATDAAAAAAGDEASDEAVQRVLFVDVINLLACEGAYASQVHAVLDASEVWAAYRGQKHDLFLPARGSSAVHGVAGLLRGPETARFALPAPPVLASAAASNEGDAVVIMPEAMAKEEKAAAEEMTMHVSEPALLQEEKKDPAQVSSSLPAAEVAEIATQLPQPLPMPVTEAEEPVVLATGKEEEEEEEEEEVQPPEAVQPLPVEEPVAPNPLENVAPAEDPVTTPGRKHEKEKEAFVQNQPAASAASPPPPQMRQELSPTKAFSDPLSALFGGGSGNNDDSD